MVLNVFNKLSIRYSWRYIQVAVQRSNSGVNFTGMYENLIYSPEHGCFNPDSASENILELLSFSKLGI